MVLDGEPPEGALDLRFARVPVHTQEFVKVFRHSPFNQERYLPQRHGGTEKGKIKIACGFRRDEDTEKVGAPCAVIMAVIGCERRR
jgi:hypothetical protein